MEYCESPAATRRFCQGLAIAIVSTFLTMTSAALGTAITGIEPAKDSLTIRCGDAVLQLQACDDCICRVRYSGSGKLTDPAVTTIVGKLPAAPFQLLETNSYVGLKTKSIEARVDRQTGAVSFVDADTGKMFLAEAADGRAKTTAQVEGQAIQGISLTFRRQPGEAVIGLGQHQEGQFNYTDTRVVLLQKNTQIGVPVLTSSAGYTLLWDNPSVTTVDASKSAIRWSSEYGETIDYYICFGPDLNQAIAGYRKLTGDAPMFGRWAWGLWQSRERYIKQEDLLSIAREYRKRRIPIDGMVQDWQYWFPQPWGSHAFGTNFPDPSRLMKELHDTNFHAIISVWAKFDHGSKNYDEMESAGNLYPPIYPNVAPAGKAKWYDAFKPDARAMYWRQINEQIGVHGWDGWWLDATEPELGGKWGEMRNLPTAAGPGYAVFNAYPLMTTAAVYEGQKARKPEVRPLILTRSAYAGQQRNGAVAWSGDIAGNWTVFRNQVPAGLNFVASGIPYWNTDTGGFFGGNPKDEGYRELFTRWFQFSAFCPMLRIHGTGPEKTLWAFDEKTNDILLTFDKLRYRLLPYIYSTAWQVTSSHASMMRPLMIDYRTDSNVYNIPDQFLFGPGLMVCPVTQPIGANLALVPPASLIDTSGKPGGLQATYYQGKNFEQEVFKRIDPTIDFDWDKIKREGVGENLRKDPIPGLVMDGFSARWDGFVQTQQAGDYTFQLRADDGMRMWIDGKLVVEDWNARNVVAKTVTLALPADSRVPLRIEYFQDRAPAIIDLRWKPPADLKPKVSTRKVYLPLGTWFDFWNGQSLAGGKTIDAEAPIERLPLFVKAGTILPMGPAVQHAGEQPHAPLEVRVYRGADGSSVLYDDAGDGYGYEKGEYATIPFTWNEQAQSLTIGIRLGRYPGMPANRQFRVVMVKPSHGVGPEVVSDADHAVDYDGSALVVKMAP